MSDTILAKEVVALRTEVTELKEMIKQLLEEKKRGLRPRRKGGSLRLMTAEESARKWERIERGERENGKLEAEKKVERDRKQEVVEVGHVVSRVVKAKKHRYPSPSTPGPVTTPGKLEVPVYKPRFAAVAYPGIYPMKYNAGDLYDDEAFPIVPAVSTSPKVNPKRPIYKPA